MPKIRIGKDEVVYDGIFLQTIKRHFRGRYKKDGLWEMVRRRIYGKIVFVAPITDKQELVLIKMYRIPLKAYSIELCAGLPDKKGESEIQIAKRELLEETGYRARRFEKIMSGPYNTGLVADEISVYLATGAHYAQKPKLENSEDITVLKIPLKRAYHFLLHPPRGVKVDTKIFAVLYLLKKRGYNS